VVIRNIIEVEGKREECLMSRLAWSSGNVPHLFGGTWFELRRVTSCLENVSAVYLSLEENAG